VTVRLMSDGELSRLEVLQDLDQHRLGDDAGLIELAAAILLGYSGSAQSIGSFDRILRPQKRAILVSQPPGIRGMSD
jgi:hypothetical protein